MYFILIQAETLHGHIQILKKEISINTIKQLYSTRPPIWRYKRYHESWLCEKILPNPHPPTSQKNYIMFDVKFVARNKFLIKNTQPRITMFNPTIRIDQQRSRIREKSGLTFFRSLNKHLMIYSIAGSARLRSNSLFPERFPLTTSLAGVKRTSSSFRSLMQAIRKPVSRCRIHRYKGRTEFDTNNEKWKPATSKGIKSTERSEQKNSMSFNF